MARIKLKDSREPLDTYLTGYRHGFSGGTTLPLLRRVEELEDRIERATQERRWLVEAMQDIQKSLRKKK